MQWSQGRTRQNLLLCQRSKQKAEHIRRSFERLSLNVLDSPNLSYSLPMLPTVDNLRNFFLTTTTEVLSFFQQLREVP